VCEQLTQGRYLTAAWPGVNSRPIESQANALTLTPPGQLLDALKYRLSCRIVL